MSSFSRRVLRILAVILALPLAVLFIFRTTSLLREHSRPKEAAPKSGHFVSAGDVEIFVQEAGPPNGVHVVLIHGFGAWSETWRNSMTALAGRGFHAVAIDMPPFGFSQKPAGAKFSRQDQAKRIIQVLEVLHLENAILVGHSVGARPTLEAAFQGSTNIRALVLVDPALGFNERGDLEQNHPSRLVKTVFAIRPLRNSLLAATATNPLLTKRLLSTFVADPAVLTGPLLQIYQKPFIVEDSTNRLGDWLKVLVEDPDPSASADIRNYSKLSVPTLLIWGDRDTVTPVWQAQRLVALIPGATLSILPGLGHIPQIENAEQFNNTLLGWIGSLKNR